MSQIKKTYEGMFLVDAGIADFQTASEPIRTMFERTEADVLALNPWEERRLAYEIKGRKRALYILAYFKLDPARVAEIEHECELDERVLRAMILRKEQLSDEQVGAETPALAASRRETEAQEKAAAEAAEAAEAEKAADTAATEAVEAAAAEAPEVEAVVETAPAEAAAVEAAAEPVEAPVVEAPAETSTEQQDPEKS